MMTVSVSYLNYNNYKLAMYGTDRKYSKTSINKLSSIVLYVVITMEFNQSTYRVDEDDGSIQIFLVLSNPSSFVVTADVFSTSDSAIGEY